MRTFALLLVGVIGILPSAVQSGSAKQTKQPFSITISTLATRSISTTGIRSRPHGV